MEWIWNPLNALLSREFYGSSPKDYFTVFIHVQNVIRDKPTNRNNGHNQYEHGKTVTTNQ